MKTCTTILFCLVLFLNNLYSQQKSIEIKILNSENNEPLKNVIVIDLSTNFFLYSDSLGSVKIKFTTKKDSIKFIIPSYFEKKVTINEMDNSNSIVVLNPKVTVLDEIVLRRNITKNNSKRKILKIECKKKYYSEHTSSGGSIGSEVIFKNKKARKLESIKFFIKTVDKNIEIRPIIYNITNKIWKPLLDTPFTLMVTKDFEEVNVNVQDYNIEFFPNEKYIVGFELIDKININKTKVLSCSKNGLITYLKPKPLSQWFKIQEKNPNFSIYYEISFEE